MLPTETDALIASLAAQRRHVLDDLDGLDDAALRRPVALTSGWTPLGLVHHLAHDVERFWFQAVVAGDPAVMAEMTPDAASGWEVGPDVPAPEILDHYRAQIDRSNAILAAVQLDAAPTWWPDFFGDYHLDTVRQVVLHVIAETAGHAGQLDAARELMDGRQWVVLG